MTEFLLAIEKKIANNTLKSCEKLCQTVEELVRLGEMEVVRECLNTVNEIYKNTNSAVVRSAIENTLVRNIGGVIKLKGEHDVWTKLVPEPFRTKMFQQYTI